jgi:hypothetical protein
MNYFEARWYDPALGRWHSPDPLEQFHSAYVGMANDPANFIDPDGRNAREWLKSNWQEVGIIACQIGMSAWCIAGCPGVGQISASVQAVTGTMAAGGTGAALIRTEIQVSNFTSSCSSNPSAMLDDALAGCGGYQSHGKVGLSFELASPDGWVQPQSNGKNVGGPEYYVGVTEQGHADAMALGDITYQYLGESASYLSTFGYVLLMPNAQWSFGGSPTIHQGTMNIVWSYNYMSEVISAQHEEWIKIAQQYNTLGEFVENTVHATEFVLSTCLTFGAGGLAINSIKTASREALPCVATKIEVVISADAAVGAERAAEVVVEGVASASTKLLNQFNSVESLIESAAPTFTKVLKHGEIQGFIKGDANAIFKAITNGGKTMTSGAVKMPDGTFIKLYQSTSRGINELHINLPSQVYKIRIN